MNEELKELCAKYSIRNFYVTGAIPQEKLNNATESMGISGNVIALYDSTAWGGSREGFVICDNGLYWKNIFNPPRFLSWDQIRKIQLSYDDTNIYIGDSERIFITTSGELLCSILTQARTMAKVENFVTKANGFLGFLDNAFAFIDEITKEPQQSNQQTVTQIESSTQDSAQPKLTDTTYVEVNNFESVPSEIKEWTIACKDQQIGPLSTSEAQTWISENHQNHDKIYVWKKGMANWALAKDKEEFADFFTDNFMPPLPLF